MTVAQEASADAVATRRRRRIGPLLPLASLAVTSVILVTPLVRDGVNVDAFLVALRILTKTSFLLFLLVFVTRPLHDLFGNRNTAWMLANRRYLGLTFAVWHLMHWPILASLLALVGPAEFWEAFSDIIVPAGGVLVVITLLAVTSNNASQRFFGKRVWGAIHTVGIYIIWVWFAKVYVLSKLPEIASFSAKPYIFVYVSLLFAAMALRLIMATRRLAT